MGARSFRLQLLATRYRQGTGIAALERLGRYRVEIAREWRELFAVPSDDEVRARAHALTDARDVLSDYLGSRPAIRVVIRNDRADVVEGVDLLYLAVELRLDVVPVEVVPEQAVKHAATIDGFWAPLLNAARSRHQQIAKTLETTKDSLLQSRGGDGAPPWSLTKGGVSVLLSVDEKTLRNHRARLNSSGNEAARSGRRVARRAARSPAALQGVERSASLPHGEVEKAPPRQPGRGRATPDGREAEARRPSSVSSGSQAPGRARSRVSQRPIDDLPLFSAGREE